MSWMPPDGPPPTSPPTEPPTEAPTGAGSVGPDAPTGGRSRRGPWALAAVAGVVAVVAGVLVVGGDDGDDGGSGGGRPAPEVAVDDDAPGADELEATVAELADEVAERRGLEFEEPVTVEVLDDEPFEERLLADAEDDADDLAATTRVMQALELLDDDVDLAEVVRSFLGEAAVGFYDPESGELVVRGAELTPYVRSTLVHELVHALDDQHFELHRPELDEATDESSAAFGALVEGSALRVQEAWEDALDAEEERELRAEEARLATGVDLRDVPSVVVELLTFPYLAGPPFVEAVLDDGGQDRLDAAFEEPPTTTAEVLEPDRYLAGRGAVAVDAPPAEGDVDEEGVFGQLSLLVTLGDELPSEEAAAATDGWVGDRYVVWRDGERTCVRAVFVMLTEGDAEALDDALRAWAAEHDDARIERDERVRLTACG